MIALDMEGHMYRICLATLIVFPIEYSFLVDDLETIEDEQGRQMVLITKQDELSTSYLQLLDKSKIDL